MSKIHPTVTPKLLSELVEYDRETGKMFWKERDACHFDTPTTAFLWNAKNAGKEIAKKSQPLTYRGFKVFGEYIPAHRAAWAIHYGKWPDGDIDHINGIQRDIRLRNLRDVENKINQRNKVMLENNTSGHTGVQKTVRGTYTAKILKTHLGTFPTFEEAVAAREAAQATTPGFTKRHGRPRIIDYGFRHLKEMKLAKRARKKAAKLAA